MRLKKKKFKELDGWLKRFYKYYNGWKTSRQFEYLLLSSYEDTLHEEKVGLVEISSRSSKIGVPLTFTITEEDIEF